MERLGVVRLTQIAFGALVALITVLACGAAVMMVSGFHSTVERECLKILLKGTVSLVACPARSAIGMRIPASWKPAIAANRMTVRSAVDEGFEADTTSTTAKRAPRRATSALAEHRNRFVASISDSILMLHASPGGKLIARGAQPVTPATAESIWASP